MVITTDTEESRFLTIFQILVIFPNEYHHMGGTRMATNNQLGVVDQDLKVHGLNNFFILGSSVFPVDL